MTKDKCGLHLKLSKFATYEEQATFELLKDVTVLDTAIPAGTKTDGATLPRWVIFTSLVLIFVGVNTPGLIPQVLGNIGTLFMLLAFLFPPFGKYALAAVLHDHLLETLPDRDEADREMKKALESMGITKFYQKIMYRAVRINTLKDKIIGS